LKKNVCLLSFNILKTWSDILFFNRLNPSFNLLKLTIYKFYKYLFLSDFEYHFWNIFLSYIQNLSQRNNFLCKRFTFLEQFFERLSFGSFNLSKGKYLGSLDCEEDIRYVIVFIDKTLHKRNISLKKIFFNPYNYIWKVTIGREGKKSN